MRDKLRVRWYEKSPIIDIRPSKDKDGVRVCVCDSCNKKVGDRFADEQIYLVGSNLLCGQCNATAFEKPDKVYPKGTELIQEGWY